MEKEMMPKVVEYFNLIVIVLALFSSPAKFIFDYIIYNSMSDEEKKFASKSEKYRYKLNSGAVLFIMLFISLFFLMVFDNDKLDLKSAVPLFGVLAFFILLVFVVIRIILWNKYKKEKNKITNYVEVAIFISLFIIGAGILKCTYSANKNVLFIFLLHVIITAITLSYAIWCNQFTYREINSNKETKREDEDIECRSN